MMGQMDGIADLAAQSYSHHPHLMPLLQAIVLETELSLGFRLADLEWWGEGKSVILLNWSLLSVIIPP